jgi:diguanylate cyclase (GGDEF)-like protein/PAS domain S-box-containing protein
MFTSGSHATLKNSIASIGASIALYELAEDNNIHLLTGNQLYEEITGVPIEQIIGASLNSIFPRYLATLMQNQIDHCLEKQLPIEDECVIDHEGNVRWWRLIFSPLIPEAGPARRILSTCVEITEKKQLEIALETSRSRFEALVESAYDGIISIDEGQSIKLINKAALQIFGYAHDEIIGKPLESLLPRQYHAKHKNYVAGFAVSPVRSRPMHTRSLVQGLTKGGIEFPAEVTISKIQVGHEMEMTAVIRDVSERSKLIAELQKAVIEDSMTGIYNRRHLEHSIHHELIRCERFGCKLALVMFDIDRFKEVNDNFGHEAGDNILKKLAELVQEDIRDVDVFGRWGGDEFLLLLPQSSVEEATIWAERIRQTIDQGLKIDYYQETISAHCSFGVAASDGISVDVNTIVSLADKALYQAKNRGRNTVVSHSD